MPTVGRKRRAQPEEDGTPASSPERETQRRRTQGNASDEEGYAGDNGGATQTQDAGVNDMAINLVRLALACEFQRRPLRRGDISEKVLGTSGRQFKNVFNAAQEHLRHVFGMEMVELPAKEKVGLQARRAAQKAASQSKSGTTSWILISTLPSKFRIPTIIQPPSAPTPAEESKYTAIYTILVSMITLSGGALPDAKMERTLRKLQMEDNTPIAEFEKTEKLMKRMEKDGYIVRIKESTGTGEDDIYWTVGPRGKVEVGDDGVRGLTQAVFGDAEEEEELERKLNRSLGIAERPERRDEEPPPEQSRRQPRKKKRDQRERDEDEEEEEDEEDEEDE